MADEADHDGDSAVLPTDDSCSVISADSNLLVPPDLSDLQPPRLQQPEPGLAILKSNNNDASALTGEFAIDNVTRYTRLYCDLVPESPRPGFSDDLDSIGSSQHPQLTYKPLKRDPFSSPALQNLVVKSSRLVVPTSFTMAKSVKPPAKATKGHKGGSPATIKSERPKSPQASPEALFGVKFDAKFDALGFFKSLEVTSSSSRPGTQQQSASTIQNQSQSQIESQLPPGPQAVTMHTSELSIPQLFEPPRFHRTTTTTGATAGTMIMTTSSSSAGILQRPLKPAPLVHSHSELSLMDDEWQVESPNAGSVHTFSHMGDRDRLHNEGSNLSLGVVADPLQHLMSNVMIPAPRLKGNKLSKSVAPHISQYETSLFELSAGAGFALGDSNSLHSLGSNSRSSVSVILPPLVNTLPTRPPPQSSVTSNGSGHNGKLVDNGDGSVMNDDEMSYASASVGGIDIQNSSNSNKPNIIVRTDESVLSMGSGGDGYGSALSTVRMDEQDSSSVAIGRDNNGGTSSPKSVKSQSLRGKFTDVLDIKSAAEPTENDGSSIINNGSRPNSRNTRRSSRSPDRSCRSPPSVVLDPSLLPDRVLDNSLDTHVLDSSEVVYHNKSKRGGVQNKPPPGNSNHSNSINRYIAGTSQQYVTSEDNQSLTSSQWGLVQEARNRLAASHSVDSIEATMTGSSNSVVSSSMLTSWRKSTRRASLPSHKLNALPPKYVNSIQQVQQCNDSPANDTSNESKGNENDSNKRIYLAHTHNSSPALQNSEQVNDPTGAFQVHRRLMGWKLTSKARRKDLMSMMDLMHTKSNGKRNSAMAKSQSLASLPMLNPALKEAGKSLVEDGYLPKQYFTDDAIAFFDVPSEVDRKQLNSRQLDAFENSISRMIKSRETQLSVRTFLDSRLGGSRRGTATNSPSKNPQALSTSQELDMKSVYQVDRVDILRRGQQYQREIDRKELVLLPSYSLSFAHDDDGTDDNSTVASAVSMNDDTVGGEGPFSAEELELRQRWLKWYGTTDMSQYDEPLQFSSSTNELITEEQ